MLPVYLQYKLVSFIFVGINFLGKLDSEMFVDIQIRVFLNLFLTSLDTYTVPGALNFMQQKLVFNE